MKWLSSIKVRIFATLAGLAISIQIGLYVWRIAGDRYLELPEEVAAEDAEQQEKIESRGVLFEVGGTPITADDLNWEVLLHLHSATAENQPQLGEKELNSLKNRLLMNLVERKVLYKMIVKEHLIDTETPQRYFKCLATWKETIAETPDIFVSQQDRERLKTRLCERSILDQYLKEKIWPALMVTEDEVKRYYDKNNNEFEVPFRIAVKQILLAKEEDAKKIRRQVTSANFSELAMKHSISPESVDGGRIGPFAKGQMPGVFDVAFTMQTGQISPILKSSYGFHILMLVDRSSSRLLELRQVRSTIEKKLLALKKEEAFQKWLSTALNQIPVNAVNTLW